tara:strand:+ start:983 stop:1264 length:282 start_codon:yes stop_codon:yes gene_type:complete
MTNDKLKQVFIDYNKDIVHRVEINCDLLKENSFPDLTPVGGHKHLLYMCRMGINFIEEGKIDKAMRWLGFIQGVLCQSGIYTIEELKSHNKDD